MRTQIIAGPYGVEEALFGIGLSYGVTSGMELNTFHTSDKLRQCVDVAKKLAHMQGGHNKFLESINLVLDIKAPRYWWQEFDTYRVGVTKQSESTIHTIMSRPLTVNDFDCGAVEQSYITALNTVREQYIAAPDKNKLVLFLQMKAQLPEGFMQRRIVTLNLKTLQNMWHQRKNHKLPHWRYMFSRISCGLAVSPYEELVRYFIFKDDDVVFDVEGAI